MLRHWKLSVVLILVAFNFTLVLTLRDTRARIEHTYQSLAQSPVAPYFADQLDGRSLSHMLDYRVERAQALGKASDSLRDLVLAIRREYIREGVNSDSMGAVDYLSGKIAIELNMQKALLDTFEDYEREMTGVLQAEVVKWRSKRDSVSHVMWRDLEKLKAKGMKLPPGSEFSGKLTAAVRFSEIPFTIHGIRSGDSIRWAQNDNASLGYDDFVNLAVQLQQTAHSPRAKFVTSGLHKMSSMLDDPGKCELYGKIYSLSAITPGELDSMTKYVLLLQWRVNRDFLDVVNELTSIKVQ